ncbi:MAG: hypothetical protein CMJ51_02505 [Planctomycetaceae bacterium]|nr:hypothetical protein [Planctomycetaceae bacterium]
MVQSASSIQVHRDRSTRSWSSAAFLTSGPRLAVAASPGFRISSPGGAADDASETKRDSGGRPGQAWTGCGVAGPGRGESGVGLFFAASGHDVAPW